MYTVTSMARSPERRGKPVKAISRTSPLQFCNSQAEKQPILEKVEYKEYFPFYTVQKVRYDNKNIDMPV